MGDDPRSLQPVPQKQQLADLLKVVFIQYCTILRMERASIHPYFPS